jgi:hypothetical protein
MALNPEFSSRKMLVFLSLLAMLGTYQRLAFVPLTNTTLLLGAPMQPTRWVKILTYLQSERFLFIIFYKLVFKCSIIVKAVVLNPYVHVLCSFQLLGSLSISLHLYFCFFTSFELMCFLSSMLGIIMIFVVSFVNSHT